MIDLDSACKIALARGDYRYISTISNVKDGWVFQLSNGEEVEYTTAYVFVSKEDGSTYIWMPSDHEDKEYHGTEIVPAPYRSSRYNPMSSISKKKGFNPQALGKYIVSTAIVIVFLIWLFAYTNQHDRGSTRNYRSETDEQKILEFTDAAYDDAFMIATYIDNWRNAIALDQIAHPDDAMWYDESEEALENINELVRDELKRGPEYSIAQRKSKVNDQYALGYNFEVFLINPNETVTPGMKKFKAIRATDIFINECAEHQLYEEAMEAAKIDGIIHTESVLAALNNSTGPFGEYIEDIWGDTLDNLETVDVYCSREMDAEIYPRACLVVQYDSNDDIIDNGDSIMLSNGVNCYPFERDGGVIDFLYQKKCKIWDISDDYMEVMESDIKFWEDKVAELESEVGPEVLAENEYRLGNTEQDSLSITVNDKTD